MKKLLSLFLVVCVFMPGFVKAQGIKLTVKDAGVLEMEANRKTAAPFSVSFKEDASYKNSDAPLLFSKYLGLRSGIDELRYNTKDSSGEISVTHYRQYFKGIKVMHGSYTLTAKNDHAAFITGDFYTVDANTNIHPGLTEAEALAKALEYVSAAQYKWQIAAEENFIKQETHDAAATYFPKGELVLSENFKTDSMLSGKVRLAYRFNIYAQQPLSRTDIYVDAVSGDILLADEIIKHNDNVHTALNNLQQPEQCNNIAPSANAPLVSGTANTKYSGTVTIPTRLVGAVYELLSSTAAENYPLHTRNMNKGTNYGSATEFTDANNTWTSAEFDNANFDNVALDAHWGASKVFDYWKTRHNRSSYDNAGAVINSYVHYSSNYDNAYWDGTEMTYGDGSRVNGGFLPLTALDVCGHEIGHAVCQFVVGSGAGLTYSRESGAMNEGFSDIWGAAIEHFADPHETDAVAKSYFDIGEEIGLPLPTPLRSMSTPKLYAQPDTYLGTNWVDATTTGCPTPNSNTNDNCGVHTNSGVLNHWFYLLVSGGSGTNDLGNVFAVPALGWVDAEHITFLGEQNLAATANYAACRTAMINAATTLFGACSLQVEAVTRAWYGVGVGANFVPCAAQIGFRDIALTVNENAGVVTCPATKTVTVRMMIEGPAPTGGNATATVTATGTATNGSDYTIATATATFASGSTADQNIILNIIDDAAVESTETIQLDFTVTANGSTATKTNTYKQSVITIIDNDTIPETGSAIVTNTVGTYAGVSANLTSCFKGATKAARSQFIWTVAELTAAGVRPNVPITAVSFDVVTKNTTIPYTGYTVAMGNTALASQPATFVSGLTANYSGNYTTAAGTNLITFSTPFTWNGTSNVVMQVCFTNAAAGTANDLVKGYTANSTVYTGYATATTGGCTLTTATTNTTRPLPTFTQTVPPVKVETVISSTRTQQTVSGNSNYYYNTADNSIIAAITANNQSLGCVTATVSAAGTGFATLGPAFGATKRSLKEVTVTPTTNGSTSNYNAIIYYTDAELAGKTPSSLLLVKTDAATDAQINGTNTVVTTPTVISGTNWKGFSGNFTGFSRFFLIDNNIVVPVTGLIAEAYLVNGHVTVKWKTETESNSSHFEIGRSYDGVHFSLINQKAAAGNSVTEKQYSSIDADLPQAANYYRVKEINMNGSSITSPVVSVKTGNKALLAVMPNPVVDEFMIQYNNTGRSVITIIDATGRKLKQFSPSGNSGSVAVDGSSFAPGVYIVMLTDDKQQVIVQKFIKK